MIRIVTVRYCMHREAHRCQSTLTLGHPENELFTLK